MSRMRIWLALLVSLLLLTACTPGQLYADYQDRNLADELARKADAMALVAVGDDLPSYEFAGHIYTDTQVSVIRGRNVEPGAKLTLRRGGGRVIVPGSSTIKMETVDYAYVFPRNGGEVFLLLRRVGEKYEIIDAVALEGGRPAFDRAVNQVYLPYLKSLN